MLKKLVFIINKYLIINSFYRFNKVYSNCVLSVFTNVTPAYITIVNLISIFVIY
jgi:hypothetical protein